MSKHKLICFVIAISFFAYYCVEGYKFFVIGELKSGITAILALIIFFEAIHKQKEED